MDYSDSDLKKRLVHTPYGSSEIFLGEGFTLLLRHQFRRAPHQVNYRSHMAALKLAGVDRIIALASTGSLQPSLKPGSRIIPDDLIIPAPSPTIFNHSIGHILPFFDEKLRSRLSDICPDARFNGTYIQTTGPRLETRSEISWMSHHADVIGMTLGNELSVASEFKIPFAAVCTVDNYANGICNASVSYESILQMVSENHDKTVNLLSGIVSSKI